IRVPGWVDLLDQLSLKECLDGTIQGSRSNAQPSASLLFNRAHNCIPVQIAGGQGKHNLECNGGERIKFSFWHSHSMIDVSMSDCKSDPSRVSTGLESRLIARSMRTRDKDTDKLPGPCNMKSKG